MVSVIITNVLGENISAQLKKLGKTQSWLADKSGIHESNISRYISGRHYPRKKALGKIATALGTTPAKLLHGEDYDEAKDVNTAIKLLKNNSDKISEEHAMIISTILFSAKSVRLSKQNTYTRDKDQEDSYAHRR